MGETFIGTSGDVSVSVRPACRRLPCGIASGLGNWLSEDPEGDVDSPNLYAYVGQRPQELTDPLGREASLSQSGWISLANVHTGRIRQISPAEIASNGDDVRRALVLEGGLDPRAADQLMVRAGAGDWIGNSRNVAFANQVNRDVTELSRGVAKVYVATAVAATAGSVAAAVGAGAALTGAVAGVAAQGTTDLQNGKLSSAGTYLTAAVGGAVIGKVLQVGAIGEGPSTLGLPVEMLPIEVPVSPYAGLRDPKNVGVKPFTPRQHREGLAANEAQNGGVLRSDKSGRVLVRPKQSRRGVTPPANEAHFDHCVPVDACGTNSFRNLQILAGDENIAKSNNPD